MKNPKVSDRKRQLEEIEEEESEQELRIGTKDYRALLVDLEEESFEPEKILG